MPGRFTVINNQRVLDIGDQLSDQELRFARGADGELDPHYALEVAIDLLSKPEPVLKPVEVQSRSLRDWLLPKRLTPLHGT